MNDKNPVGRPPEYTQEDYYRWLELMRQFLQRGNSLHYSAQMAGLSNIYWKIIEVYNSDKAFSKKVDAYRAHAGELTNDVIVTEVERIKKRQLEGGTLTGDEIKILQIMAEKHRTSQPFFVTRTENAEADPNKVGKVLDTIEQENISDYDDVGQKAKEQMVADEQSVQDKG